MSRRPKEALRFFSGFPRVSGDEPGSCPHGVELPPFSPRERG